MDAAVLAAGRVPFEIASGVGRDHPDLQYADRPTWPKKVRDQDRGPAKSTS